MLHIFLASSVSLELEIGREAEKLFRYNLGTSYPEEVCLDKSDCLVSQQNYARIAVVHRLDVPGYQHMHSLSISLKKYQRRDSNSS